MLRLPICLILILAFTPPAFGQSRQDWRRVLALSPNDSLIVKRNGTPKVKGGFVRADEESVVLRTAAGEVTVERQRVRRILVRRKGWGAAPWIGAAVGFSILAAIIVSEGDFNQPAAALTFGAGGAGLGALGGLLVRAAAQNRVIYEHPEQ